MFAGLTASMPSILSDNSIKPGKNEAAIAASLPLHDLLSYQGTLDSGCRSFWQPQRNRAGRHRYNWQCRVRLGKSRSHVATYELLIGLLSVALPAHDRRTWHERLTTPPSRDELADAFAPLIPWFQLDGDGPRFMQDLDALPGEDLSPDGLLINAAGANAVRMGTVLFVRDEPLSRAIAAAAAIVLYALQSFAPSGGAGHRTSMRGGGPLTTLARFRTAKTTCGRGFGLTCCRPILGTTRSRC